MQKSILKGLLFLQGRILKESDNPKKRPIPLNFKYSMKGTRITARCMKCPYLTYSEKQMLSHVEKHSPVD